MYNMEGYMTRYLAKLKGRGGGDIYGLIQEKNFFLKRSFLGVKSCEKSIARIAEG